MPDHFHAVVWIDHHEAKIFHFSAADFDAERIRSAEPHQHLHHKANTVGSGHAATDSGFLERVAKALDVSGAMLITGPAGAKHELLMEQDRFRSQFWAAFDAFVPGTALY